MQVTVKPVNQQASWEMRADGATIGGVFVGNDFTLNETNNDKHTKSCGKM